MCDSPRSDWSASGGESRRHDAAKGAQRISQHREKYWRSAGFRRTKRSRIHKRSECFFNETKLQKNVELKSISGLKLQLFQLAFNPAFCQYHVSRSVFFSASNPQASHFSLAKFLYKYLLKLVFLYPSKYQIVVQLKHFSLC